MVATSLDTTTKDERNASLTVRVHPRAERVENASDSDFDLVLSVEVEKEGFGYPLALVVAGSHAYASTRCTQHGVVVPRNN